MSSSLLQCADVIVVGAGPAGSATALGLAQRGLRVVMLERRSEHGTLMGESLRALARDPLQALGLWEDFLRQNHRPSYLTRALWGGEVIEKDSLRHQHGPDHHLDRPRFDAWLVEHARKASVNVLEPARIQSVERRGDGSFALSATVGNSRLDLTAPTLVDATGRSAWLMRQLGARRAPVDRLVAHARWFHAPDASAEVLVESGDHGWWYSAPLPDSRLAAVYFTDADGTDDEGWETSLASAPGTRARLGNLHTERRATFSATPQITEYDPALRCFPVGDAALCFDPLAAYGLWFALASAHDVARIIADERDGGPDLRRPYLRSVRHYFEQHLKTRRERYAAEAARRLTPFWHRDRTSPRPRRADGLGERF